MSKTLGKQLLRNDVLYDFHTKCIRFESVGVVPVRCGGKTMYTPQKYQEYYAWGQTQALLAILDNKDRST